MPNESDCPFASGDEAIVMTQNRGWQFRSKRLRFLPGGRGTGRGTKFQFLQPEALLDNFHFRHGRMAHS